MEIDLTGNIATKGLAFKIRWDIPNFPVKIVFRQKNHPLRKEKFEARGSPQSVQRKKGLRILSNLTVGTVKYY